MDVQSKVEVGAVIRAARKSKGLTANALGAKLTPPVSANTVTAWERGQNNPSVEFVRQISTVLEIDVKSFYDAAGEESFPFFHIDESLRAGVEELGDCYAKMSDQQRDAVLTVVRSMVS